MQQYYLPIDDGAERGFFTQYCFKFPEWIYTKDKAKTMVVVFMVAIQNVIILQGYLDNYLVIQIEEIDTLFDIGLPGTMQFCRISMIHQITHTQQQNI